MKREEAKKRGREFMTERGEDIMHTQSSWEIRSDQIRSDQIRSDQIRSDKIRSDQIRSDVVYTIQ